MNDTAHKLREVRENIKSIEDILKKVRNGKSQIFIRFKEGRDGEQYKDVQVSDWGDDETATHHSTEIYRHMLEALRVQEEFWMATAKSELKELEEELKKI